MYLEVYPDIIFILNFFIDFTLLLLLKKVNRKDGRYLRIAAAAAIGALSAVIAGIFPWMNMLIRFFIMNIAAVVLMVLTAFGKMKFADLAKQVIVLNLITYFTGGLINSVYYHTGLRLLLVNLGNGMIFSNVSWIFIGAAVIVISLAAVLLMKLLRWYKKHAPQTFEVELVFEDRSVHTMGLMDTGNCLYDPVFKRPVMVMDNSLMEKLLPPDFNKDFEAAKHYMESNELDTSQWCIDTKHLLRLRFIPYRSIGKSGMLIGINLDKVLINTGKETVCNEKVTAAVCDNQISSKGDYHVILHKDLV